MFQTRSKRKHKQGQETTSNTRRPGRPRKKQHEFVAVQRAAFLEHLMQVRSSSSKEPNMAVSQFESLPVELIQSIFFSSLEINLLSVCTKFREALASDQIYRIMILFAFFDDDGSNPVETKHFLPATYRQLTLLEKVRLQSEILSCRWCTLTKLRSCLPTLRRLNIFQIWHERRTIYSKLEDAEFDWPSIEDEAALENGLLLREDHERLFVVKHMIGQADYSPDYFTYPRSVFAARVLPDWLLIHSGLDDNLSMLRLLREGHMCQMNDRVMILSARALHEGMRRAIVKSDVTTLEVLVEIQDFFLGYTKDETITAPKEQVRRCTLPLDLMRLATKQDRSIELMCLLLRAGLPSLAKNDDTLTKWALVEAGKGQALGTWVLDYMAGAFDAVAGLPLDRWFNYGQYQNVEDLKMSPAFPYTTFGMDLNYIDYWVEPSLGLNGSYCGNG